MSGRTRPPTDETRTKIFDSKAPKAPQPAPESAPESTARSPSSRPPTPVPTRTKGPTRQGYESGSVVVPKTDDLNLSITPEPLRAISMKSAIDRAKPQAPKQFVLPKQHKPEIRSLEEVSQQRAQTSGQTGRIAPPREAKGVRARKLRDTVFWGSVVVIIGCVVMLAVWFIAR